jgi:pimeloyl-ACP methyl ester carboxylesterase
MKPRVEIAERRAEVAGLEVYRREAGDAPILYLHGVPTASWDWEPFLARTGGVAPDLPGFGSSAKPGDFDYSIPGYADFLEAFCAEAGLGRVSIVMHDWGVLGLAFAQRNPERVERIVLTACVPLLPGYRWHRVARAWRTPVVGELTMGFSTRFGFRRSLPRQIADRAYDDFDHGTQRAILKLYRSARENVAALDEVTAPALVLWGERDPYLGPEWADRIAAALGGETRVERVPEAGHWPWLTRPEILQIVQDFVQLSAS